MKGYIPVGNKYKKTLPQSLKRSNEIEKVESYFFATVMRTYSGSINKRTFANEPFVEILITHHVCKMITRATHTEPSNCKLT